MTEYYKIKTEAEARAFAMFMMNEMNRHSGDIEEIVEDLAYLKVLIARRNWDIVLDIIDSKIDGKKVDPKKAWVDVKRQLEEEEEEKVPCATDPYNFECPACGEMTKAKLELTKKGAQTYHQWIYYCESCKAKVIKREDD